MNLSRLVSSGKSGIDFKNQFNRRSELKNIQELMLLKGNRCTCTQGSEGVCGDFCKRLTPEQEKVAIKRLIQQENDSFEQVGRRSP
jgi:hypothetical protein